MWWRPACSPCRASVSRLSPSVLDAFLISSVSVRASGVVSWHFEALLCNQTIYCAVWDARGKTTRWQRLAEPATSGRRADSGRGSTRCWLFDMCLWVPAA